MKKMGGSLRLGGGPACSRQGTDAERDRSNEGVKP